MLTATLPSLRANQNNQDDLVLSHMWLVRHIVGKLAAHLPSGVDLENLESAGVLGLVEAARKFDDQRGIQFKTYAYTRIRGAILDELRRNCPLPQQVLEQVAKVRQASEELQGTAATVEQLAAAAGLSADQVSDSLSAMRLTRMLSWESASENNDVRADRADRPEEIVAHQDQVRLLAEAIEALPERERLIVTLYYMEDLRLKEIGKVLTLSESRVSRLLSAALYQLKEFIGRRERVEAEEMAC